MTQLASSHMHACMNPCIHIHRAERAAVILAKSLLTVCDDTIPESLPPHTPIISIRTPSFLAKS